MDAIEGGAALDTLKPGASRLEVSADFRLDEAGGASEHGILEKGGLPGFQIIEVNGLIRVLKFRFGREKSAGNIGCAEVGGSREESVRKGDALPDLYICEVHACGEGGCVEAEVAHKTGAGHGDGAVEIAVVQPDLPGNLRVGEIHRIGDDCPFDADAMACSSLLKSVPKNIVFAEESKGLH